MMKNMQNNYNEDVPDSSESDKNIKRVDTPPISPRQPGLISRWMNNLAQMGLGESLLRVGTNLFSIVAIVAVILLAQAYYHQTPGLFSVNSNQASGAAPTAAVDINSISALDIPIISGISRAAQLHTNIPSRPRTEITTYVVNAGDTVYGIADKFGLDPKTIFAANFALLQDDPHNLSPGQELQILPTDGVYWEWLGGISFGAWADYYQVKPEDIINYPANKLDAKAVGDAANANIPVGTWLVIPGGKYEYHTPGSLPLGITRTNPASAQVGGAGSCPAITGGAVGTGTFVYPTDRHYLSGFDYNEKTNHRAIDLAGMEGDNIYASDGGVVVYAGANSYGYGNMVMIDHGTGFQTLYAHMSQIFVSCGENVAQGQVIGSVGATGHASGPHLHFEVRTTSTVINPWNVLPPP
jgi:murein DD-endopeptidase MepM/ murein hydrolase activator NlpD